MDPQASGPRPRTGGYVLELCGQDLDGDPYYSEVLVFRDVAGELRAIEPLYWMGITIADDDSVGREPDAACDERCAGGTLGPRGPEKVGLARPEGFEPPTC